MQEMNLQGKKGHHAVNLIIGQAGTRLDFDLLLLAGCLVDRADVHDAVGIDIE